MVQLITRVANINGDTVMIDPAVIHTVPEAKYLNFN